MSIKLAPLAVMTLVSSPTAAQLACKYQVIAFDQRGTGRSPVAGATYSIDEYCEDIDAVARHFGVDKFHLFGHSWSGLYVQIDAERQPCRVLSIFLSSPSSGTAQLRADTEREVMSFNRTHSSLPRWSAMAIKSLLGAASSDTAYRSLFLQVLENYNREFDPAFSATDAMVENVRAEPINKTRKAILGCRPLKESADHGFPIAVAYGEKDIYGNSKRAVRKRVPGAAFWKIGNAGHIAWRHNPEEFNKVLGGLFRLG